MIERYALPKMRAIWSTENKYSTWLRIEILALEAQAKLGVVPESVVEDVKQKAGFDIERIDEIEREVHHDVIAFLTSVSEHVGEAARYVHHGLTSYDVVDTGLSLLMKEAADVLIDDVRQVTRVLKKKAFDYKDTLEIGRTHGVHAEPIVFGQKFAIWAFEMDRNRRRLEQARETISYGKLSGVVGSYSNANPQVEQYVCEKLGLKPGEASSQVLQRDRHAEYMTASAVCAATIEKIALEIRGLQRTEIMEAEEPFAQNQKGSSAMPHKRNPVVCERLTGMARLVRTNALAALEDVALWQERDISHSSVERVIIPDTTTLLDYMLVKLLEVLEGLVVHPDNMLANLERTRGIVFSQRVLLALVEKGLAREEAYRIAQKNAFDTWRCAQERGCDKTFKDFILQDPKVSGLFSSKEIEDLFDTGYFLRNVSIIFDRLQKLEA